MDEHCESGGSRSSAVSSRKPFAGLSCECSASDRAWGTVLPALLVHYCHEASVAKIYT